MIETSFKVKFLGETYQSHYIKSYANANEAIDRLTKGNWPLYAIDTETRALEQYRHIKHAPLSPHLARIRLLQIFNGKDSIIFDLDYIKDDSIFIEFLETHNFIAHNATFDLQFFKKLGVLDMKIGCTMLAAKLLFHALYPYDAGLSASLDSLCLKILKTDILKKLQASDWMVPKLTFEQLEYAAVDAIAVFKLAEKLSIAIKKNGLERIYNLCKDSQHPITDMKLYGISVDKKAHKALIEDWRKKLWDAKKELLALTGLEEITPQKIGKWLEKNLPPETLAVWPKTATGKVSTDANTLSEFSHLEIVAPFSKYQKLDKLTSSFGSTLLSQINSETQRLHPQYWICGARTGRLSCSEPNIQQCYSKDTEILTYRGWIRIPELKKEDYVAQWAKDLSIKFVKPLAYFKYHGVKNLIHLKNTQMDLLVTPQHRCLTKFRNYNRFEDCRADQFPSDRIQFHAGKYEGGTINKNPWWIKLLVAVQADGYLNAGGINFAFNKIRKFKRLKLIMKHFPAAKFTRNKRGKKTKYKFRLCTSPLVEKIVKELGENKNFSWDILNWNKKSLRVFVSELRYWDGLSTRKSDCYTSVVEHNADVVQTIFALSNRRAHKRKYTCNNEKNKNHSIAYCIDVPETRMHSMTTNVKKRIIKYNNAVYCVETPSSYLLTRRNGKILVSGNSPRDKEFRSIFTADEGKVLICADYSQIELRIAAEVSQDSVMQNIYRKGLDLHSMTASMVAGKPVQEITKEERQLGKALGLGLLYGLGAKKFAHYVKKNFGQDISQEKAIEAVQTFYETYPEFRAWQQEQAKEAQYKFLVTTPFGKVRKVDDESYYGASLNHPIQGGAAEVMLCALINLEKNLPPMTRLVACVHDEVIVECHKGKEAVMQTKGVVEKCMVDAYLQVYPRGITHNLVSVGSGFTWAEAK